jgi:hypothetical protein
MWRASTAGIGWQMNTITTNNSDYDLDSLSDEAKAQLQMLQLSDQEIARP